MLLCPVRILNFISQITEKVHKDRRQGVRVQPRLPPHPAHQAGQPSLPAGAASPVHPDKLHGDQRRPGGPAAGLRGQHGEARPGGAEGERGSEDQWGQGDTLSDLTIKRLLFSDLFYTECLRNVKVNPSRDESRIFHSHQVLSQNKTTVQLCSL